MTCVLPQLTLKTVETVVHKKRRYTCSFTLKYRGLKANLKASKVRCDKKAPKRAGTFSLETERESQKFFISFTLNPAKIVNVRISILSTTTSSTTSVTYTGSCPQGFSNKLFLLNQTADCDHHPTHPHSLTYPSLFHQQFMFTQRATP